ncbi:carbamoyltransferase HypF [Nocardia takedensis]|uniref:carbamoyltransferase HypF n=1 Tax=Nocardia takedensis TaxID=259390 RepID=UPI003F76AC18
MIRRQRRRLVVRGLVQGVGMRPFVHTAAAELALSGWVGNDSGGAFIEVEGPEAALDEFTARLRLRPPPLAVIDSIDSTAVPANGEEGFHIAATTRGSGRTLVCPDIGVCVDCEGELRDPGNRRYRHPFISCTNCGPRFTIVTGLPYDRERTTMADFAMCDRCAREYADPADRRFHTQSIACHDCGPEVTYRELDGFHGPGRHAAAPTDAALIRARAVLRAGGILAVKGLGGYHLACDATNIDAVSELRRRKRRETKPFAVMVANLAAARRIVLVDDTAAALLTGPARPIVLLRRRTEPTAPAGDDGEGRARGGRRRAPVDAVAPGNPELGVMLAYTPLHLLLFGLHGDSPGPPVLVMTSGNLAGEPLCYEDQDARARLAGLADAVLFHDRRIVMPCDDSVVRAVDGEALSLRRSRGHVPLPLTTPFPLRSSLAVGGDPKNVCAVGEGDFAWPSQHIGDMDDPATLRAFGVIEHQLEESTGVRPRRLVTDAHPGYRSTGWAVRQAAGRPVHTVQHHHAHVASVMGEHALAPDESVLGIAFDGTGYGSDGAVWGGEVLAVRYAAHRRLAHLAYVPQAGGDVSVRRPYRMALAHLWSAGLGWPERIASVRACPPMERDVLARQFTTGFGCVPTSSMGRLFDAVASLAGVRQIIDFEAQAAIDLEHAARGASADSAAYRFRVAADRDPAPINSAPVVAAVVRDATRGVPAAVIAARFHAAVARLVLDLALVFTAPGRLDVPVRIVALAGGVFQNALLLSTTRTLLREHGVEVICARRLPPNDGGLAYGQLLVAGAD